MRVKVMKPIFKPDFSEKFVLYPYWIFHLKLFYKRLGRSDRILDYFAYVDLYRFGAERGDRFIELYEWDVDEKQVMKPLIDYEDAKIKAFESAITWGNSRIVSWWLPRIEIVRDAMAYKVFWIFERDDELLIMDSLDGKEFDLEKLTGNDGRKCRRLLCR